MVKSIVKKWVPKQYPVGSVVRFFNRSFILVKLPTVTNPMPLHKVELTGSYNTVNFDYLAEQLIDSYQRLYQVEVNIDEEFCWQPL